jgi:PKD repeat protein
MPNGGVILYYLWDFGDGSPLLNTTDPITTHVYTAVGNYTVTLTVGDSEGLNDTISKTVKLRAYPTAEFTWSPETPIATEQVTFNATLSEANSGNITEYVWDFGDGTVVGTNYPIKKHTYSSAGNYSVTLTIKNSEGLSSSITKVITVLNAPPVASFGYSPDFPLANETVTFNASLSYDPDGTIVSYTWDFGDGNTTSTANTIIYHAYASPGNYTVNLTVMDDASATASTTKTIKIVAYPTAEFTWSPSPQEVSKPVTFNATMSKANSGVIVSYTWDFGDGNTTSTTDPIIIHTYAASGNYTVTLTVKNSDELSSNITKVVTILPSPPEANFYWEPTFPLVNQTVTFNASSSEPNGGIIKLYEWDFGDGTPIRQSITDTITHTYTAYGEYNVTLRVTDTEDLSDTVSKIVVVIAPPTADFEWSPEAPKTYETITFNASASSPNGGTITSYTWDFGDGNTTTVANPIITHYYETAGNYTVTLNVTDSEGLWATMVKEISIEAAPQPQAFFEYSPDQPYVFEEIIFNASTSTTSVGTITDYVWDFGDGNTTTTTDPIITYSYDLEGNYTVTLTILTSIGQNATTSKLITILPICGPTAEFTWSPLLPRYNQTVTFNASASTPGWNGTTHPPIVYYVWDFGDGNTTTTTDPIIYYVYTQDGNYTVTLTVIDVNGDNSTITKTITVTVLIGDVNGDGKVDIMDIAIVAKAYGSYPGMDNWNPDADVNGDGKVDIMDIAIVAKHYGEGV